MAEPPHAADPTPAPAAAPRRFWTRRRFIALGAVGGTVGVCAPIRFGGYGAPAEYEQLRNFSATQATILESVVDTMLPPDADRGPAALRDHVAFIDGYLVGLDPDDVDQLGRLLYLLEHLTLPFGPYLARFTRLGRDSRADYLYGWQTSAIGLRRLALRSLKTLVFLAYYRSSDAFASIHYPGPIVPVWEGLPESRARYEPLLASPDAEPSFAS